MAFQQVVYNFPTFITGTSISPSIQLSGSFLYLYLIVPPMSSMGYVTNVVGPYYLQGSSDNVNFYRYSNPESNTSPIGTNDFVITTALSQRCVFVPNFGMRYVKVELTATSTTPASNATFQVVCVSEQ